MKDTAIPYELPDVDNHSFFFIDQRVKTNIEVKLHRHDAWELYCVVHGYGRRMAGDTLLPFAAGDVALIPPGMFHRWEYAPDSADEAGCVRYLMVAFDHSLVRRCMDTFPELRNRLSGVAFPTDALQFGPSLSATNAENQQIAKQTPSFAPKNVKSGVFVLFKIIQPLHNKRVAILKESDEKRLIFIYPFSLIFQDFTSS